MMKRRGKAQDDDEELSPSFMDETVLEQIRSTKRLILDRSSMNYSLAQSSELSEKEINEREDEIPEEFMEFFSNQKNRNTICANSDFRISREYSSRDSSELRFSHDVHLGSKPNNKSSIQFRSSRQTKKIN